MHVLGSESPGGTDSLSALLEGCHGFLGCVGYMVVVVEFAIEGYSEEFGRSGQFYGSTVLIIGKSLFS